MKKAIRLTGVVLLGAIMFSGCMSTMISIAMSDLKASFNDYGIYDESVPENKLAELRFSQVKIKTFNGNPVQWEGKDDFNLGRVRIPSGTHDIVFDWLQKNTRVSDVSTTPGSRYSPSITTYTWETTTRSITDIPMRQLFKPGHKYLLAGVYTVDGSFHLYLDDMTNTPSGFWGDDVPDAPKASNVPTEFEGTWTGPDNVTYTFAGNTWEQSLPPGTTANPGPHLLKLRGTFNTLDGKLNLFLTDSMIVTDDPNALWKTVDDSQKDARLSVRMAQRLGANMAVNNWIPLGSMRQAFIYTYSRPRANNLILEMEGKLPKTTFVKK